MMAQFMDPRLPERFWDKVSPCPMTGCWLFVGAQAPTGYGSIRVNGIGYTAHRFAYEMLVGAVSDGLQIDHLCRVRCCCNPAHLEAVTQRENIRRGDAGARFRTRTHCFAGHEYTPANTRIRIRDGVTCRVCLTCQHAHWIKRAKYPGKPGRPRKQAA